MQCQTSSTVMPRQEENCDTQTENLCSREEMLLLHCACQSPEGSGYNFCLPIGQFVYIGSELAGWQQ